MQYKNQWQHGVLPKYKAGDQVGQLKIVGYLGFTLKNLNPNTNGRTPEYTQKQHQYRVQCDCGSPEENISQDALYKRKWCLQCTKKLRSETARGVKPPLAQAIHLWPVPEGVGRPEQYGI